MAVNSTGSRKIVVDGVEFRWRATGSDGWISVCVWPKANDRSRVHGRIDYDQTPVPKPGGVYHLHGQVVVTNRLIRRIVLHYGVAALLAGDAPIHSGPLESIIDVEDAVRSAK